MVSLADAPASVKTDSLSVVADAVSTAYQAVQRSGLKAGDVIIRLGNTEIASENDLVVALIKNSAGQTVTLEYYRDGKKASIQVTLGTP